MTGNVHKGFTFEIRRNYDYSKSRKRPRPPIEIGLVSSEYVVDTPGDGTYTIDSVPQDAFEACYTRFLHRTRVLGRPAILLVLHSSMPNQSLTLHNHLAIVWETNSSRAFRLPVVARTMCEGNGRVGLFDCTDSWPQ